MTKHGGSSPFLSTTSTASLNTPTFLRQVVGRLVNLLTSSRAMKAMLWLGKWKISIFLYAILMAPSMHKFFHSTHPSLLSRCTQVGPSFSHPTTRNSPCCNISFVKLHFWKPVQFLDDTPKYWLEDDGTMCLHPSHRWKSDDTIAWLRKRGLHSVPDSIKAEIGDLVYNGPKMNDASTSTSPPGRFVYFTGGRASNDPPPGLGKVPWQ